MKILHAPLDIAGVSWSLVQALNALGHEADLATIDNSKFTKAGNIDLSFRQDPSWKRQWKKYQFTQKVLPSYDAVHYHAGRSILDYGEGQLSLLDLKAAARRGQVVAMTYHGCEVRGLHPELCAQYCKDRICENKEQLDRIKRIEPYVDLFYVTTPDLLSAVPQAQLMPQSVWGLADVEASFPCGESGDAVRVLHMPSRRDAKGSSHIIKECQKLVDEGLNIDFVLVEGAEHKQALLEIAKADVVIDQLIMGWYCVLSVEAAALGKAVVVGLQEEYEQRTKLASPPFTRTTPETLASTIRELVEQRSLLADKGRRNRDFALERHDALAHAKQSVEDYQRAHDRKRR